MANPNPVDGAAARLPADVNDDEAMEVDTQVTEMMNTALMYCRPTANDLLRLVGRKPGEIPTQGDMQHLGELVMNRLIFSSEATLTARQIEADDEAARRRREMAADADFSHEINDMFDELFPLESCVPADNKLMGKQVSTTAAQMREKKKNGGFAMDSAADWLRTRQELDETFRDGRLGNNEMAKCWLAFEVASPSTRANLKDLGIIRILRQSPKGADYQKHFVQPQNSCFNVMSASANARNSINKQRPHQAAHEDVAAWHRRLVAVGNEAFGDLSQWDRESRTAVTLCFIQRSRYSTKLTMHVNRELLESANCTIRNNHLEALNRLCGEKTFEGYDAHPLDDYHLKHASPAVATPASSLAVPANSDQKSSPWKKPGGRRYPDRPPKPAPQVNWIKRDGNCSTCNLPADHDTTNCTRPAVCWTCGSAAHQRFDCPEDPSPPPKKRRGTRTGEGTGTRTGTSQDRQQRAEDRRAEPTGRGRGAGGRVLLRRPEPGQHHERDPLQRRRRLHSSTRG